MKNDTILMWLKGSGLVGGAMASAFVGSIAQWSNEGSWPSTLNWLVIGGTTMAAGFSALVAFCSGSVTDWVSARNGVDKTPKPTQG